MCQNIGKTVKIIPALEESTRGKDSRMTRKNKRQYGTGALIKRGRSWMIRWGEKELAGDGTEKRIFRSETLGPISRKDAADILAQRVAASSNKSVVRSRLTFRELINKWKATVLPM